MNAWHILRTDRDAVACEWLGRLEIESYRPVRKVAVQQGRQRPRVCSMFAGYVFANINPQFDIWPTITELPGVIGYLRRDDMPATITDQAIDAIREYEFSMNNRKGSRWPVSVGQQVRIAEDIPSTDSVSLFAGYEGLLRRLDKKDRATVEMIALGRHTLVELDARWLEITDRPRWRRRPKELSLTSL